MKETTLNKDFLSRTWRFPQKMVEIPKRALIRDFGQTFLGFGSCFALEMMGILKQYGFRSWVHPNVNQHFSTITLAEMLSWIAEERQHDEEDLYFFNEEKTETIPYRYFFANRFYGNNAVRNAISIINELDIICREAIIKTDVIILTLGTSRIGTLNSTGHPVCRLSGIPANQCQWQMLSVEENVRQLDRIIQAIKYIRGGSLPSIFISLSPQRYFFDRRLPGSQDVSCALSDNMLSKSILRVAISKFVKSNEGRVEYFPSYEMVLDELRPYDTMESWDHTHVNNLTPMYVVKKFIYSYVSPDIIRELHFFDNADVMINRVLNALDQGASYNNQGLRETAISIARSIAALKTLGCDLTYFRDAMKIFQALDMHTEAVKSFDCDPEPRMRWKVAISLIALGDKVGGREILESILSMPEDEKVTRPALMADCIETLGSISA